MSGSGRRAALGLRRIGPGGRGFLTTGEVFVGREALARPSGRCKARRGLPLFLRLAFGRIETANRWLTPQQAAASFLADCIIATPRRGKEARQGKTLAGWATATITNSGSQNSLLWWATNIRATLSWISMTNENSWLQARTTVPRR